jgi:hypothetical protein
MGHSGERSRGDSRLRDWSDAEWRLICADTDDPAATRFFTAYGRDVDVPETALQFDPATRRLTVAGGSRRTAATVAAVAAVRELLRVSPKLSGRAIEDTLVPRGHPQKTVREALGYAVEQRQVTTEPGPRRAVLHSLAETERHSLIEDPAPLPGSAPEAISAGNALATNITNDQQVINMSDALKTPGHSTSASVRRSASVLTRRGDDECVSAYIGDALHSHGALDAVRQPSDADALICPRCRYPAERLVLGLCPSCAYPAGGNPDDDTQED